MELSLIHRLKLRASIRRNIQTRKSVQEGKPDRISDLLEEAAIQLEEDEQFKYSICFKVWKFFSRDGSNGTRSVEK
jgi:hypothetical protein